MFSRRALLYMPGDDLHKIQKGAALGVDTVCMDMEDGVAANRKEAARHTIVEALRSLDFGGTERLVRINPAGSGLEQADLEAALEARPDGIVLPKVQDASQIRWLEGRIADAEAQHGWPAGEMAIVAIVESALGIVNLQAIASAGARLQALVFGAEDFAGDAGLTRTPEAWEVFYARSAVVTHAAANGLQAIDMVYIDFKDTEGLRREAEAGARLGFTGKQIIHPAQVAPVQEAFTPSEARIAWARRLVEAFEAHQKAGKGAFALDGQMIDAPLIKNAEKVLARARAAGKI